MSELDFKICIKCGISQTAEEFPLQKNMKSGKSNTCKSCKKEYQKSWRTENKEHLREYESRRPYDTTKRMAYRKSEQGKNTKKVYESREDVIEKRRLRAKRPDVLKKRKEYGSSEEVRQRTKQWQKDNPVKHKAQWLARKAIYRGNLVRTPCSVCGDENSEAHHEDYSRPLDVIFYCKIHHRARHKELRDAGFVWDELGRPVLKDLYEEN